MHVNLHKSSQKFMLWTIIPFHRLFWMWQRNYKQLVQVHIASKLVKQEVMQTYCRIQIHKHVTTAVPLMQSLWKWEDTFLCILLFLARFEEVEVTHHTRVCCFLQNNFNILTFRLTSLPTKYHTLSYFWKFKLSNYSEITDSTPGLPPIVLSIDQGVILKP